MLAFFPWLASQGKTWELGHLQAAAGFHKALVEGYDKCSIYMTCMPV